MKKTLIVLALLVFVLPLSACSLSSKKSSNQQQDAQTSSKTKAKKESQDSKKSQDAKQDLALIKKNRATWNKLIKDAEVVKGSGPSGDFIVPTNMSELNDNGDAVVKGTIYNMEQMSAPKNMAFTKAKIRVEKVLNGDDKLEGKDYYVVLRGGLTTTDVYYADMNRTKEVDHNILVEDPEEPLPKIGTRFIGVLGKNYLDDASDFSKALLKSGFTKDNSRALFDKSSLWIKDKSGKYVLNNPKGREDAKELTKEINEKYNK